MKTPFLFVALLLATLVACEKKEASPDPAYQQRIDSLTTRIAALEQENSQLRLKGRISSSLKSGLDAFFDADEFWENVIDVGQQECANRCIQATKQHREACAAITDDAKRLACYQEASDNAAACQKQCFGR